MNIIETIIITISVLLGADISQETPQPAIVQDEPTLSEIFQQNVITFEEKQIRDQYEIENILTPIYDDLIDDIGQELPENPPPIEIPEIKTLVTIPELETDDGTITPPEPPELLLPPTPEAPELIPLPEKIEIPIPPPEIDPDPNMNVGRDPKVFGDWKMIPDSTGHRADWDNDIYYCELGTYVYSKDTKILINDPQLNTHLRAEQFESNVFTHIWQDMNQNMIIDDNDILIEKQVILQPYIYIYPWGEYHTNGNLIYMIQYSYDLDEYVYSTEMRYNMHGILCEN